MKTTSVGERIRAAIPDSKASVVLEKTVRDRDEAALTRALAASTEVMAALKQ